MQGHHTHPTSHSAILSRSRRRSSSWSLEVLTILGQSAISKESGVWRELYGEVGDVRRNIAGPQNEALGGSRLHRNSSRCSAVCDHHLLPVCEEVVVPRVDFARDPTVLGLVDQERVTGFIKCLGEIYDQNICLFSFLHIACVLIHKTSSWLSHDFVKCSELFKNLRYKYDRYYYFCVRELSICQTKDQSASKHLIVAIRCVFKTRNTIKICQEF